MKDIVSFSVPGSDSICELQLGLTLIRFAQFDLAYFRDQCVGIYRKSAPENFLDKSPHIKEYLHSCHPYCKAQLKGALDFIALDCVIDDICLNEDIGLEELWVKNMTAQDAFGQALFRRITDYKTGQAINQWTNLARMQAYAVSKMNFIYGGEETDGAVHRARKLYYDLAFTMTAAELGFSESDFPKAEISSVPFLPQAGVVLKTAVNDLAPVVKAMTKETGIRALLKGDDAVRDQMAGIVIKTMSDLRLPEDEEIDLLVRKYSTLPSQVFAPSGLKAVIDLEFDQMLERGFYIRIDGKTHVRMKYSSKKDIAEKPETADTPDPDETEKKPAAKEKSIARKKKPAESKSPEEVKPDEAKPDEEQGPVSDFTNSVSDSESGHTGKVRMIIDMAEAPDRKPSKKRTIQEVNTRCNLIWTSMNVRTGWSITAEDASEWFRYLTRLRFGIGTGELTPESLDKFLDATLEVYKLLPENT